MDSSSRVDDSLVVVVVDDQRTFFDSVSSVSVLALSGSDFSGLFDFLKLFGQTERVESVDEFLGFIEASEGVNDQRDFRNVIDSVASGQNKGRNGGSRDRGGDGVSSLGKVDFSVPSSPSGSRVEHSSATAHVTEGTLSGSVGSGSADSGNSGDCSSSSPGLCVVKHTGFGVDGVGLSSVFVEVVEDEVDDVVSDWGEEDLREGDFFDDFVWFG